MDEEELVAVVSFFIAATISIKIIATAVLRAQELKFRGSNPQQPVGDREMAARIERIEQAVDSIAVEVERISENQRFTTKLLAEREGVAAPRRLSS